MDWLPALLLGACASRPDLADPPRYALALRTADSPLPGDLRDVLALLTPA